MNRRVALLSVTPRGEDIDMETRQLALITDADSSTNWRLDEHTRQVGRQGIAAAREALRAAIARDQEPVGDDRDPAAAA
jgi:hypothetical protein